MREKGFICAGINAWGFNAFDGKKKVCSRKIGYIYSIEPLERIAIILRDYNPEKPDIDSMKIHGSEKLVKEKTLEYFKKQQQGKI